MLSCFNASWLQREKKKPKRQNVKPKKKLRLIWLSDHQKKIRLLKKLKRKKVCQKRTCLNQLKKISLKITIRERG